MKRFWKNFGVTVGTAIMAGVLAPACAHNDASIFLSKVFQPVIPTNGECEFTADPSQPSISVGTMDVSFGGATYTPEVLVGNQIVTVANPSSDIAETSRVFIQGAITRITDLNGNDIVTMLSQMCNAKDKAACMTGASIVNTKALAVPVNPFSTVETTTIEPGQGTTPSYASMGLTMVDSDTVDIMRAYFVNLATVDPANLYSTAIQIKTFTKLEGVTEGGDSEESNEFEFAVTFLFGGLVENLEVTQDGACLDGTFTKPMGVQVCVYGQDQGAVEEPGFLGLLACGATAPADAGSTITLEGGGTPD